MKLYSIDKCKYVHVNLQIDKKAFETPCNCLQEIAIEHKSVLFLTDVNNHYCHFLYDKGIL